MSQHPFPDSGPDGEEPDSSPLPPAAEGCPVAAATRTALAEQGLYVCLPAEAGDPGGVRAGRAGGHDGRRARCWPSIVDAITGEDGSGPGRACSDDQLVGDHLGGRGGLEARAAWTLLAAVAGSSPGAAPARLPPAGRG